MKLALVISAIGIFACANGSGATRAEARGDCKGELQAATGDKGAYVFSRPDPDSSNVAVLKDATPVCASADTYGFGFRRVTLQNGSEGFMQVNSLSQ